MLKPEIATTKPFYKELKRGRTYYWCSCGRSKRQPFCDGSHQGTGFEPVAYTAQEDNEEVLFCGCKQTGTGPFCDGTHNNLLGGYAEEDPDSPENRRVPIQTEKDGPRTVINGGCYVFSIADAKMDTRGNLRHCLVIGPEFGALHQSQYYAELPSGRSPVIAFGERDVILTVVGGHGAVTISGRDFAVAPTDGVYVRPNEAFSLQVTGADPLKVFISAGPGGEIGWQDEMPDNFDATQPQRLVKVDPAKRNAMGKRFFQVLVDKNVGSTMVTQFIGHIPLSKGVPHRHLYEEALIILTGGGYMWTEDWKAPVKAGDVIFLPRKQIHSLQCTAPEGMDVVGVIYPGDNPSINY